jgi:CRISPR-associated exonuclease Cas4
MNPEPVVQIAAIEHYAYCPRQCALIYCDGVWAENRHTVRGIRIHKRADNPEASRAERGHRKLRAVPLWSNRYGLAGRSDIVELHPCGIVYPVEYKSGTRHGMAADFQLCAQAICLEEMLGVAITKGAIWYGSSRRRRSVMFTHSLREQTLDIVEIIRSQLLSGQLPDAPNDSRCKQCQLLNHCLPDVVANPQRIRRYLNRTLFAIES